MITKNLDQFLDNFTELERKIECGYIPQNVAYKIDKFARVELANGILSLVSSFNNLAPFLDIPTNLYLASDNAADTFEVGIEYIDQNRDRQVKTFTLNGTTPVDLGMDIYCVYRMYNNNGIDQLGVRVVITSNVSGVPTSDAEIYNEMIVTSGVPANQSLTGVFSVPRGYTAFITSETISADKGSDLKGATFTRKQGKVFRYKGALQTFQQQSSNFNLFRKLEETTDFKPLAIAQTGGIAYFEYTILVINNDYLNKHVGV